MSGIVPSCEVHFPSLVSHHLVHLPQFECSVLFFFSIRTLHLFARFSFPRSQIVF